MMKMPMKIMVLENQMMMLILSMMMLKIMIQMEIEEEMIKKKKKLEKKLFMIGKLPMITKLFGLDLKKRLKTKNIEISINQ
jgi:hypothetical protein